MFGIGSTELLVILVVALLVLGPKNLPQIARTLGKALGEFRRVSTDFQRTLNTEIAFEEASEKRKKDADAQKQEEEKRQAEEKKQEEARAAGEAAEMASAAVPGATAQTTAAQTTTAQAASAPATPSDEAQPQPAQPAGQEKSV